jgi:hypothetical protein
VIAVGHLRDPHLDGDLFGRWHGGRLGEVWAKVQGASCGYRNAA